MDLGLVIAGAGLLVASIQLHLQRQEIIRNGKIEKLIHLAEMVSYRIDYLDKIIEAKKAEGQPKEKWIYMADTINKSLRPQLDNINKEIINNSNKIENIDEEEVLKLLKMKGL